jgi:hypothetical protein
MTYPIHPQVLKDLTEIAEGDVWQVGPRFKAYLAKKLVAEEAVDEAKKQRTLPQNNAIHKWLTDVALELDKGGHTIQNVVAAIKRAEIRPTMLALKEVLWRPYMIAATGKESTTQLDTAEVDKVYEGLNKFLGENFELFIPFPSEEGRSLLSYTGAYTPGVKNEDGYEYDVHPYEPPKV